MVLEAIGHPRDLRKLTPAEVGALAGEIRAFLVENVSRTGGHLGPNLGVVELTIALHRARWTAMAREPGTSGAAAGDRVLPVVRAGAGGRVPAGE